MSLHDGGVGDLDAVTGCVQHEVLPGEQHISDVLADIVRGLVVCGRNEQWGPLKSSRFSLVLLVRSQSRWLDAAAGDHVDGSTSSNSVTWLDDWTYMPKTTM